MLNETRDILRRLADIDRRHQKEAGTHFLLCSVKYACLAVLAIFALDVVLHLNSLWRLGIFIALIFGALAVAVFSWRLAFVRKNRLEHVARFLESRDAAYGSRLINLLQLAEQSEDASLPPLTRQLARQAVLGYLEDFRGTPMEQLAWTGQVRRGLRQAAWSMLAFASLLGLTFNISSIELARYADPFGDHPPYSFTRLEILQPGAEGTNVIYGKGIVLRAKATGHHPAELFLTAYPPGHPEKGATLPMFDKGRSGFDQLLDNIRGELVAYVHTKDEISRSKQVHIGVILTPQLEKAFVQIAPPAYTGIAAEEKPYLFKGTEALEGSVVRFRLQSNRPLREGTLEISGGDQPPVRVALKKSAENEVTGSFIAADSGRLRFSVTDVAGLPSQGDCEGALTVTHDLPPEVRLVEPDHDAFVAMDFKLNAQVEATDDYGLRSVRLHRGLNGVFSAPKETAYHTIVRDARETTELDLADLGIEPGDTISLFAEAVDTAPQAHLARSQSVRLRVISVEDYNNFLREETDLADTEAKYTDLLDHTQELIERQKQLGEAAQKLEDQIAKADPKQKDALTQSLDNLMAQQSELNDKLNKQAERMDHFVRDNPIYDVEKDLQQELREEAAGVRQSAQTNNAEMAALAQQTSPPTGGRKLSPEMLRDFEKSSNDQVARLSGKNEQSEKEITKTLEDMSQMQELTKDFSQFESLFRAQQDIAQQAQAYNRAGQLSRENQLALKDMAATEKQVDDLLGELQSKLRDDATAAEKLFPKAAQSGRALADKIGEARMQPLAAQATGQMLAGNGDQSFQAADRLRGEMEKLFSDCQSGNCPSGDELDGFLRLQKLKPGDNFAQISRSQKFGKAQGRGGATGQGQGSAGSAGFAMVDGSKMQVLGNEQAPSRGSAQSRQSSRQGSGRGTLAANDRKPETAKTDAMTGLNPINRQSGAVSSEAVIEEYNDVVDSYFKAITTKKKP